MSYFSILLTYCWENVRLDNRVALRLQIEIEVSSTRPSFSNHEIGQDESPKLPRCIDVFDGLECEF